MIYSFLTQGREAASHLVHTQEIAGSIPAPATNFQTIRIWASNIGRRLRATVQYCAQGGVPRAGFLRDLPARGAFFELEYIT